MILKKIHKINMFIFGSTFEMNLVSKKPKVIYYRG